MNKNITKLDKNNNYYSIDGNYIAGLVHADGTFTAPLIKKNDSKIYINPRFILTQHIKSIEIIKNIKKELNNKGNIKNQNNNISKYTITNKKDIYENVIPYFDKYQVRGNRYLSYLKFKLLVNILINEKIEYKSSIWYFCIILATYINPLIPINTKLHYLNEKDKNIVINKIICSNLNYKLLINKYCSELNNINIDDILNSININLNTNKLNKEFINGLIDGDGSLSVSIKIKKSKLKTGEIKKSFIWTVTLEIIQDIYNKDILLEIKNYFNDCGNIRKHLTDKSISYFIASTKDLNNIVIPKLLNISLYNNIKNNNINWNKLTGPKIKLYKFYNYILITSILNNNTLQDIKILNKIINLVYNIIENPKNISLNKFKQNILNKIK